MHTWGPIPRNIFCPWESGCFLIHWWHPLLLSTGPTWQRNLEWLNDLYLFSINMSTERGLPFLYYVVLNSGPSTHRLWYHGEGADPLHPSSVTTLKWGQWRNWLRRTTVKTKWHRAGDPEAWIPTSFNSWPCLLVLQSREPPGRLRAPLWETRDFCSLGMIFYKIRGPERSGWHGCPRRRRPHKAEAMSLSQWAALLWRSGCSVVFGLSKGRRGGEWPHNMFEGSNIFPSEKLRSHWEDGKATIKDLKTPVTIASVKQHFKKKFPLRTWSTQTAASGIYIRH